MESYYTYFYLCQGGYVFNHVGWFVGFSTGLYKNYSMDIHDTWMEDRIE